MTACIAMAWAVAVAGCSGDASNDGTPSNGEVCAKAAAHRCPDDPGQERAPCEAELEEIGASAEQKKCTAQWNAYLACAYDGLDKVVCSDPSLSRADDFCTVEDDALKRCLGS